MKVLFCGFGRSGKDACAIYISKITGLRYAGSFSWQALSHMAKVLNQHPCQAWEERHQNRELWKRELDKLREKDQCFLAREVLKTGDVAAGIRDKKEIDAVKAEKLFDYVCWIERVGIPIDPTVTYGPEDCDSAILNNGTLDDFHLSIWRWADERGLVNVNLGGRCV